jgi:hypothetical protein
MLPTIGLSISAYRQVCNRISDFPFCSLILAVLLLLPPGFGIGSRSIGFGCIYGCLHFLTIRLDLRLFLLST